MIAFSLNFTTAALDPRITFIRPDATATRVNQDGLIETVAADTPRFDFDPITLACRGLLIEGQRENLFLQSTFQSGWADTRSTLVPNSILAPDGTMTGAKLVENNQTSTSHRMSQSISYVAGNSYSISTFAKAGERSSFGFRFFSTAFGSSASQYFDLQNGVLLNAVSGITASITPAGDGWYRCTATRAATASATSGSIAFDLSIGTVFEYDGDGVSGAYFWGAQIEAATFPTSYIPTTTAALTRNADVATITGTNFSNWWQANKGGILVSARPGTVSGTRPLVQFDDGTINEVIAMRGNTTNPELYVVDGGVVQAQIDAGTIAANSDYSLTGWWSPNDCKARLDSGAVVTDTSATIPTVTQARLGSDGTNYLNGHLASISYYDVFSQQIYTRRKNKAIFNLM